MLCDSLCFDKVAPGLVLTQNRLSPGTPPPERRRSRPRAISEERCTSAEDEDVVHTRHSTPGSQSIDAAHYKTPTSGSVSVPSVYEAVGGESVTALLRDATRKTDAGHYKTPASGSVSVPSVYEAVGGESVTALLRDATCKTVSPLYRPSSDATMSSPFSLSCGDIASFGKSAASNSVCSLDFNRAFEETKGVAKEDHRQEWHGESHGSSNQAIYESVLPTSSQQSAVGRDVRKTISAPSFKEQKRMSGDVSLADSVRSFNQQMSATDSNQARGKPPLEKRATIEVDRIYDPLPVNPTAEGVRHSSAHPRSQSDTESIYSRPKRHSLVSEVSFPSIDSERSLQSSPIRLAASPQSSRTSDIYMRPSRRHNQSLELQSSLEENKIASPVSCSAPSKPIRIFSAGSVISIPEHSKAPISLFKYTGDSGGYGTVTAEVPSAALKETGLVGSLHPVDSKQESEELEDPIPETLGPNL